MLSGNLTDMGTASSVNASFLWGTSPASLTSSIIADDSMDDEETFSVNLTGLSPYVILLLQGNGGGHGSAEGEVRSFTTLSTPRRLLLAYPLK